MGKMSRGRVALASRELNDVLATKERLIGETVGGREILKDKR